MNHTSRLPGRRAAAGFTLIELLVVISIISVIAAFGVTKIMSMRDSANLEASKERLGQIYFQLNRYESKEKRLPTEPGSEMIMAVWGRPYVEKSVNNAKIMFCESLPAPALSEETLDEDVTAASIHWAGRNQAEREYRVGRINERNASKTIIACNKPMVSRSMPHGGDYLAVIYLDGSQGDIERADFPDWGDDEPLIIGPESPVEALHGLVGHPDDDI